ncbi:MAG: citrate transporter [Planctomycetes bacterium]|nr:citrate transporter [Planctomycetota bacterium]
MTAYILFGLFALTLLGIATLHKYALPIALGGLAAVLVARLAITDFHLIAHLHHEWQGLLNLGGLLLGFAVLANHFERSHLPDKLTQVLPGNLLGVFLLLALVWVLSAVLDNIAAALIGGTAARALFKGNVHIGYLAAIVAASNAGGAGSVVGDTTTTMIWLDGVSPFDVMEAALGAFVALAFFGGFAARQQYTLQPIVKQQGTAVHVDSMQLLIVGLILVGAIGANLLFGFPAAGVWGAIVLGALLRRPDWSVLPGAAKGMVFLLSLVLSASMMPVEELPAASPATAFGLGIVSSFFDNIPLTKLALAQGGYDWGYLAYCVGFGGSMLWFGSSAGVALSGMYPQAKSAGAWLKGGWHVAVGYVLGFVAMILILGWHPHAPHKAGADTRPAAERTNH